MERSLSMELVRVTELAALSSARWVGRGMKNEADHAATEAMRKMFDTIPMEGIVVIGEGEMDEAPMLYIGEKLGTGKGPMVDIAVDPVEGTNLVAKGGWNSIAVLAVADRGNLLHAPDMYMEKIAVGPECVGCIDINASITDNLKAVAKAKNKEISDVLVTILDRERHAWMIQEIREAGARIKLITDGDLAAGINTCFDEKMGIDDVNKVLYMDDLVKGDDAIFAATGITDGELLKGVQFKGKKATTSSVVMRAKTGTVRFIEGTHNFQGKLARLK